MKKRTIYGSDGTPYLTRTTLCDLGRFGQILLHRFHRADLDPEMHDHPWSFWSLVLRGWYVEELGGAAVPTFRRRFSIAYRQAAIPHRIAAMPSTGCATLLWTSAKAKEREWGFYTRHGWVAWRDFFNIPEVTR